MNPIAVALLAVTSASKLVPAGYWQNPSPIMPKVFAKAFPFWKRAPFRHIHMPSDTGVYSGITFAPE